MGILATNAAEALDRQRNEVNGQITDLQEARLVELVTGDHGTLWINVDGICMLRVQRVESVFCDVSKAKNTDKVVTG